MTPTVCVLYRCPRPTPATPTRRSSRSPFDHGMNVHVTKAARLLLCLNPRDILAQVEHSTKVFYKSYISLHRCEVQIIPKSDTLKRKKAMNNISGRASKLKKDWLIALLHVLTDGLREQIAATAAAFLPFVDSAPPHLRAHVEAMAARIEQFRRSQAECAAASTSIHDLIIKSARADGRRASETVFQRKLAEATSASASPLDSTTQSDRDPPAALTMLALPPVATSLIDAPTLLTPMTPQEPASPLDILSLPSLAPAAAAAIDDALEPFTPEALTATPEIRLPPAIADATASPQERRHAKSVTRKIKNTAAATRTNQTRRSLVSIYTKHVEMYASFLADLSDLVNCLKAQSSANIDEWLNQSVLSHSHGAA